MTAFHLVLIAGVLMMFSQTGSAVMQTAQILDRVTADKVEQLNAFGH
jgi:hypothetical protein